MSTATALYLVALFLITLFTEAIFGINAQSLAYVPISLALIALLLHATAAGKRDIIGRWYTSSPLFAPGLLFLAGLAAALPQAQDLGLAGKDFLRWSFVWLVFAPVTRAVCADRARCRLFARAAAAFITLFATLTAVDLITGLGLVRALTGGSGVTGQGRYMSLYGNAGIFAGMLIVGFPLSLAPALTERSRWRRIAWTGATAVMAGGMLLSGSRAAVVASVVAAMLICLLLRRRMGAAVIAAGAGAMVVLMLGAEVAGPPSLARFQHLLMRSGSGYDSLQHRMDVWESAGRLIETSPLIGRGGAQLRFHQRHGLNRAHNAWLDAWLDGGLPALLAMILVTAAIIRRMWLTWLYRPRGWLDPTHVALLGAAAAVLVGWTVRAGIGSRIDWLPTFMVFSLCWDAVPADPAGQDPGDEEVIFPAAKKLAAEVQS
jgi:O-antigen ligase